MSVCTSSSDAVGLLAGAKSRGDGVESALECETLVEREDAGAPERDRPRLGELHVERPEPEVDADRAVERVELRARSAGEAAAPELVRGCAHELERGHATAIADRVASTSSSTPHPPRDGSGRASRS